MRLKKTGGPLTFDVLTIFPKMFEGAFSESLLGKAQEKGLLKIRTTDIRDFADNKHKSVDDRPYGGGAGMVMMAEPIYRALEKTGVGKTKNKPYVIYLSPQGKPLTQKLAGELARKKHLVLLCGHYEGIDERLFRWIDLEVSVGDVVYTGGEIPAMALVDAVARTVPGVIKEADSVTWDSFSDGWQGQLDCPHYTRPALWRGHKVPPVLLSGHHKDIQGWRADQSQRFTQKKRPDLVKK